MWFYFITAPKLKSDTCVSVAEWHRYLCTVCAFRLTADIELIRVLRMEFRPTWRTSCTTIHLFQRALQNCNTKFNIFTGLILIWISSVPHCHQSVVQRHQRWPFLPPNSPVCVCVLANSFFIRTTLTNKMKFVIENTESPPSSWGQTSLSALLNYSLNFHFVFEKLRQTFP